MLPSAFGPMLSSIVPFLLTTSTKMRTTWLTFGADYRDAAQLWRNLRLYWDLEGEHEVVPGQPDSGEPTLAQYLGNERSLRHVSSSGSLQNGSAQPVRAITWLG